MDKRKTVFTAVVIGAGIMAIIDRIRLHNKVKELEERTDDIGRCHNDFCLMRLIGQKTCFANPSKKDNCPLYGVHSRR